MRLRIPGSEPLRSRAKGLNSVLVERRRLLHRRTGAAIESLYRDRLENHYANLARHYRHSDDVAKAVEYLRLASEQAVEQLAYSEAAADLKAAIALVGGLPEGTDRLRIELALHITEGSIVTVLHGIGSQERERAFERACEISERLGDTTSLLRGSIFLSFLYIARGEPVRSREICSRHIEWPSSPVWWKYLHPRIGLSNSAPFSAAI